MQLTIYEWFITFTESSEVTVPIRSSKLVVPTVTNTVRIV